MSIVFKPNIKKVFSFGSGKVEAPKVKKQRVIEKPKPWSNSEMTALIELRALRVPIKECVTILDHSYVTCCELSQRKDLNQRIIDRRIQLIKEAMK